MFMLRRLIDNFLNQLEQGKVQANGFVLNLAKTGHTDSASWYVYDTRKRQWVFGVYHHPHVGQHVLYFFAIVELDTRHNVVIQPLATEWIFQRAGLRIRAIDDGYVTTLSTFAHDAFYFLGNVVTFGTLITALDHIDRITFSVVGPKGFTFAFGIVTDHSSSGIDDLFWRAVVLLKLN